MSSLTRVLKRVALTKVDGSSFSGELPEAEMEPESLANICAFIDDAMGILRAEIEQDGLPRRGGVHVEFREKGGHIVVTEYDDFLPIIDSLIDRFRALPSVTNALLAREQCLLGEDEPEDRTFDLLAIVSEIASRHGIAANDDETKEIILQHVGAWELGTIELQTEVALARLSGDINQLRIADDVQLIRFDPETKTAFYNEDAVHFSLFTTVQLTDVLPSVYYLSIRERIPRYPLSNLFARHDEKLIAAVSALRLSLDGGPGVVAIRKRYVPKPGSVTGSGLDRPLNELASYSGGHDCHIAMTHEVQISTTYARLMDPRLPWDFQLALRRFNQSFERRVQEDAVVDLAVCAEATLLPGINEGESAFRMRLIGVALLGNDVHANDALFKKLSKARNRIVHSAETLETIFPGETSTDVLRQFQELIRRILCRCLERISAGESIQQINTSLLKRVFAGLSDAPGSAAHGTNLN